MTNSDKALTPQEWAVKKRLEIASLERGVMEMDLSQSAVDKIREQFSNCDHEPVCSFAQALGAIILGCDWREVQPGHILVIEHQLERRQWGGPNE